MAAATTQAERQAQVLAAGYNGPLTDAAINAAYARTATPADLAASGLNLAPQGTPGMPTVTSGPAAPGNAPNPQLAAYTQALQASSGFSIKQLDEQVREFNATLDWQKQMWQNQGLPELAIKQRAQDLEDAKFKEFTDQAIFTQNLQTRQEALDEQVKLGNLSVAEAQQQLAREIQTGQLRVQQGQLGLDTLKTAASLSGPENWVQAANFNRGVANSQLPAFVSDLLTGRATGTMGGAVPGAQMSAPLSFASMANDMGVPGPGSVGQPVPSAVGTGANPFDISAKLAALPPMPTAMRPAPPPPPRAPAPPGGVVGFAGAGGAFSSYGASSAPVFNAPGPNSPNDTARGSLMPGTTGMFQGATQNYGFGPGQGSTSITGTRGSNITGYDPATGQLHFDLQFLQPKSRVVTGLYDVTAGRFVVDPTVGAAGSTGTYNPKGPGGWSNDPYLDASSGAVHSYFQVDPSQIDPTHQYTLQVALPDEGGVGSDINDPSTHPQFSGAQIHSLPNPNTQGTGQSDAAQAAAWAQYQQQLDDYNKAMAAWNAQYGPQATAAAAAPSAAPSTPAATPAPAAPTPAVTPAVVAPAPVQPGGFWSQRPDGSTYFTPSGGVAAMNTAPGGASSMDPNHMAQFYATAVQAANTGGATTQDQNAMATPADVATAFGRPAPTPATASSGQPDIGASTNALSKLFAAGGQALAPQQLEGLTPTELKMLQGGGAAIGVDVPGYVQAYQNSRIGQTAATPSLAGAG